MKILFKFNFTAIQQFFCTGIKNYKKILQILIFRLYIFYKFKKFLFCKNNLQF